MSNVGIYKITSPNNKVYIGQSWDLNDREGDYRRLECPHQRKLHNSIIKYGWEAHQFKVIMYVSENVTQQMFDEIEQHYMDYYRKLGFELMNIREAGSRGKHSEETKRKIGDAHRGKKVSPDSIEKMKASKANPSDEIRANLSSAQKKLWSDPEYRKKMSDAHKGYVFTEEHLENMRKSARRGADHHTYGKEMPQETRDKISQSTRGQIRESNRGAKNYKSRPVLQFDLENNLIKEWPCIKQVERELGINNSNICAVCKGSKRSAGNFIWRYKTDN